MPRRWISRISARLLVVLATLVGMSTPASAAHGGMGYPLAVCVVRGTAGAQSAPILVRPDCETPQRRFGKGSFRVIAQRLPPDLGLAPAQIRVSSLWQDRMTLHVRYGDGHRLALPIDDAAASRHMHLGSRIEQSLPMRGVPIVGLAWQIEGAANLRGILIDPRIVTPEQTASANLILGTLYAAFAGLCVALIVYNLALWRALRHDFQLAYCAMVAAMLAYAFSSSGALAWAWPDIANTDRIRINYALLACAAAAALIFARNFFGVAFFAGWIDHLVRTSVGALLVTATVFVVLAPWQIALLDRLYGLAFAFALALVPALLWQAWRRRSAYLWLFTLAWAAPMVLASVRVAKLFPLSAHGFWIDNSALVAMTAEAMLSSLAIAYRIHLLSLERDAAREQEIAARLLADIDPLTGLMNRRAFLREAIGCETDQRLFLADIDHFKRVNDTLGHDGGDEVLRVIARALRTIAPPGALIARIGGEEFAIVVGSGSPLTAAMILDQIRGERMPFDLAVTASIGFCTGELGSESDWKTLYRRADRALFEAKAAGRDRARHGIALAA